MSEQSETSEQSIPKFDMSRREFLMLKATSCLILTVSVVGAVYYYKQWESSMANPAVALSHRKLTDEKFPLDFVTAIPPISTTVIDECNFTKSFEMTFGWENKREWFKVSARADWRLVNGFAIATAALPFQWFFNSSGDFVEFSAEIRVGKQCSDARAEEMVRCPDVRRPPDYSYFDDLGLECRFNGAITIEDSGVLLQFHSRDRNVTHELASIRANGVMDASGFLLSNFPEGRLYPFQPRDVRNYVFEVEARETVHPDHTKSMKLLNTARRIPFTAGEGYWLDGERHYVTVVVSPTVMVLTERIQLNAIAAATAYATSATTLLGIFGYFFPSKVVVPYHFKFGGRAEKYTRHVVFGADDPKEQAEELQELQENLLCGA